MKKTIVTDMMFLSKTNYVQHNCYVLLFVVYMCQIKSNPVSQNNSQKILHTHTHTHTHTKELKHLEKLAKAQQGSYIKKIKKALVKHIFISFLTKAFIYQILTDTKTEI